MSKLLAKSALAALSLTAVGGAIAVPVLGAGKGNTVFNCYGIYYNTDWDQTCGSGGASQAGIYNSTGDCTASADRSVSKYRARGNRTTYDGGDCRFQVVNVRTNFGG